MNADWDILGTTILGGMFSVTLILLMDKYQSRHKS